MTYKTMMTDGNQFANKTMALNLCLLTNQHAFLNFRKRANKAIIPNAATIEVHGFNEFYMDAKFYIDDPGLKNSRFNHRYYFF